MKTVSEYKELSIPDYALSYLVNNDSSGIEQEDKNAIDAYMAEFYQEAEEVNGYLNFSVDGEEGYFTWCPEFGEACNCYECTILILADD